MCGGPTHLASEGSSAHTSSMLALVAYWVLLLDRQAVLPGCTHLCHTARPPPHAPAAFYQLLTSTVQSVRHHSASSKASQQHFHVNRLCRLARCQRRAAAVRGARCLFASLPAFSLNHYYALLTVIALLTKC